MFCIETRNSKYYKLAFNTHPLGAGHVFDVIQGRDGLCDVITFPIPHFTLSMIIKSKDQYRKNKNSIDSEVKFFFSHKTRCI